MASCASSLEDSVGLILELARDLASGRVGLRGVVLQLIKGVVLLLKTLKQTHFYRVVPTDVNR